MAKNSKDESPLAGFDSVISNISGGLTHIDSDSADLDGMHDGIDDPDDVADLDIKKDVDTDTDPDVKKDDTDTDPDDDKKSSQTKKPKSDEFDFSDDDDTDDDDTNNDAESSQVGLFFDAFSEALGWDVSEDENKPSTVEELVDYMRDLVEENSTYDFVDDRVKELDEYIRNGGNFEDYYSLTKEITDFDHFDLEDENNQKQVITEYLKSTGYNDQQIKRKIERWDEAGMLEDEAKDDFELLKETKLKQRQQMAEQQAEQKKQAELQQKEFYTGVVNTIDNLKEIRGITIPAEDRKKLKEYAFKIGADGKTQYQKDYGKNLAQNFIESAYFTMKGDALLKSAKNSGESSAISKLKQTMKSTNRGKSKHDMDNNSPTPIWKAASSIFGSRRNND